MEAETTRYNPREDYNLGVMVCFHSRYNLGDKSSLTFEQAREIETNGQFEGEPCIVLPVYLYDHGGLRISTEPFSCPWDSGQIGIVYATYSRIRDCYGRKRVTSLLLEKARRSINLEVQEYDRYLA